MPRIVLSIFNLFLLCLALSATNLGCAQRRPKDLSANLALKKSTNQRVYYAPYESVWRASQLALKYPIAVNNMETGFLETEYIKGIDGFIPPESAKEPSQGVRYKISMILVKGKTQGKDSVRLTITKSLEKKRDFFSEPEALESDGLEEKVLFYRVEREIAIEEAIKKSAPKDEAASE